VLFTCQTKLFVSVYVNDITFASSILIAYSQSPKSRISCRRVGATSDDE